MEPELLQEFIEETERHLPEICEGVTAYWQNTQAVSELEKSLRNVQAVNARAQACGLDEAAEIGDRIEAKIVQILASQSIITSEQNHFLLEQISKLEVLVARARESISEVFSPNAEPQKNAAPEKNAALGGARPLESAPPIGVPTAFADYSVETEKPPAAAAEKPLPAPFETVNTDNDFSTAASASETAAPAEADEFEIDEEMLEIFAFEAEDLLQNIGANLTLLEKNAAHPHALLEIRRSAHTLKGSAGIVGFAKVSDLAHRVEDLLDYLSDNEIPASAVIVKFLTHSTDCLEALTNRRNSAELNSRIADLYRRFDEIMAALQNPPANSETEPLSFFESAAETEAVEQASAAAETTESTAVFEETVETDDNQAQPVDAQNRSVVRVSLDRLDDLIKLVSEMYVTRSAFERRLVEFEREIQELLHSTNRLRRSTGKLEIDYEAATLGNQTFGFQSFNLAAASQALRLEEKIQEFDTLEFDRYTDFHQTTRELIETAGDVSAIHNEFGNLLGDFGSLFDTQRRLVEEMQDNLLRLRMVSLNSIGVRLHRIVRMTAKDEAKQTDLEIENGDLEIDTQILDAFVEPLLHLLRNAVAHGIEPPDVRLARGKAEKGKIILRAYSEGTHVVFVVSDDGRGISAASLKEKAVATGFLNSQDADRMSDEEAFSLIFLPGLSTASEVNQISGRGVGMNIVKTSITRRQGTIAIKSEPNKGTSFIIRLPMALAATRALFLKSNEQTYACPLKIIKQIIEISVAEYEQAAAEKFFTRQDAAYKFFNFNELLKTPVRPKPAGAKVSLLLLEAAGMPYALAVDQILRPEEIVIKPLGSLLLGALELVGATITGDGSVVPVLDLIYLLEKTEKNKDAGEAAKTPAAPTMPAAPAQKVSVLIVDDSPSVRHMNSKLIKSAGWLPVLAKDGLEALELLQSAEEFPAVILTDVEMPRMDGYEFLAAVKREANLSHIPVIMITSRASDKHRRKAYDLGVSEYLGKPFEESALIEKIKGLIK